MKHLILIISLFTCILASNTAKGQAGVVTDPGAYSYFAEQLRQATQSIEVAEEQLTAIKNAQDKIEKFNDKLKGISTFVNVVNDCNTTIRQIDKCIEELRKLDDIDYTIVSNNVQKCTNLGIKASSNIADISEALKSNNINMTDYERLKFVEERLKEIKRLGYEATRTYNHIKRLNTTTRWITKF